MIIRKRTTQFDENVEVQADNGKRGRIEMSDSPSIVSWNDTGLYEKVGELDQPVAADVQPDQQP